LYRVTDTCIPEDEAMKRIEGPHDRPWNAADAANKRCSRTEFF
jgi:hypothetical protein